MSNPKCDKYVHYGKVYVLLFFCQKRIQKFEKTKGGVETLLSLVKLMYFCSSVKKEFRSSKKTKGCVETLLSPVKFMYFCSSVKK